MKSIDVFSNEEKFTYEFVELESWNIPFVNFLKKLTDIEIADILTSIDELLEFFNRNQIPPSKISKFISDGIFELRVSLENKTTRSFYFYLFGKRVVFTHGIIKKTNKTDPKEIEKAKKYKNIYLKRNVNEN